MVKRKPLSTLDAEIRLRRQAGRRPQRPVILVVCEGQTEKAYFHAVVEYYRHQTNVNVQIERAHSDPVKVVEKGKRLNKQNDFDHVFCVVDGDKPERIEEARKRIRKKSNIELIVSTPCFELWLLLHFEASDAPFVGCAKVCDRLRQQLPDYVKGNHYDFAQIVLRSDDAIRNAKWLAARGLDNPATHLHLLLNCIRATP